MKKLIALLVGENQDIRIALSMLIPPLFFVVFILLSFPIDYKTVITAILGFDIFAGLLSNFQEKTHEAWRKQPKAALIGFVVFHLTIYPLAVIICQVSIPLMVFMLGLLITKTAGFAIGTNLWK